ncbi:hypothetical protein PIB30_043395 [Stylosanthes scabra]|uniref:Uncharacterized protein n=1 Tax=Stylosanthes scabra TaxID=79078 RepID=A0ABU6RFU8_9FABA|nr:hypothetical protein [Stylosanthes scabra]
MEDAPLKDAGAMEVDGPISVEEEALTTELTIQHITTQPVIVLALEKHVIEESVIVPRQVVTEELTLRDLPETKSAPAKEVDIPTDKDIQKQMDLGMSIVAEMVASGDYLDFTQPSFDLGSEFGSESQGQPQEAKIYEIDDEEEQLQLTVSQELDAGLTQKSSSQEGSLFTPGTIEPIEKLNEEEKKL